MTKQCRWIQAIVLWFAFFSVYVFYINRTANYDEMFTFFKYTQNANDILLYDFPNNHILHSFLVWISTSLLGNSLLAIRFPAFIAGILSLAVLYRMASRWENHHIGLIAMIFMGITLQFTDYSVNARGYTLVVLISLLLITVVSATFSDVTNLKRFYMFVLSFGIILTLPSSIYLIIAIIAWQFINGRDLEKIELLKNSIPNILSIIIGIIVYLYLLLNGETHNTLANLTTLGYTEPIALIADIIQLLFANPSIGISIFIFFVWGIVISAQRNSTSWFTMSTVIFLGAIVCSAIQGILTQKYFFPRNYIYLLPLTSLLSAIGIYSLKKYKLNVIIPLLLFITGLWGIQTINTPTIIDVWRGAIEENVQDGDIFFVGCCIREPLFYYISTRQEMTTDYFKSANLPKRIIFIPTLHHDLKALINMYRVQQYITKCNEEMWNSQTVIICLT